MPQPSPVMSVRSSHPLPAVAPIASRRDVVLRVGQQHKRLLEQEPIELVPPEVQHYLSLKKLGEFDGPVDLSREDDDTLLDSDGLDHDMDKLYDDESDAWPDLEKLARAYGVQHVKVQAKALEVKKLEVVLDDLKRNVDMPGRALRLSIDAALAVVGNLQVDQKPSSWEQMEQVHDLLNVARQQRNPTTVDDAIERVGDLLGSMQQKLEQEREVLRLLGAKVEKKKMRNLELLQARERDWRKKVPEVSPPAPLEN